MHGSEGGGGYDGNGNGIGIGIGIGLGMEKVHNHCVLSFFDSFEHLMHTARSDLSINGYYLYQWQWQWQWPVAMVVAMAVAREG
jgi:hypothetical protein